METIYKWLWRSAPVARKGLKLLGPLAIASLALSGNYIFQVNFGLPALHARPVLGLVWQIVLWSIYLPFWWCFIYCCTAKPWDPKALFSMDPEEMTSPRMCEKCRDIKPPRAHHCSLCDRCILRMDHHCIWLGTCIGEHNYKSFILILVYTMALCAFYVISSFRIMHLLALPLLGPGPVILWYILCGVGFMTIPFVGFHIYLILHNCTTLEFFARLSRHPSAPDSDMFDHGSFSKNWREVFGHTISDWLVPTANPNSKTRYVIKKRPVDL